MDITQSMNRHRERNGENISSYLKLISDNQIFYQRIYKYVTKIIRIFIHTYTKNSVCT